MTTGKRLLHPAATAAASFAALVVLSCHASAERLDGSKLLQECGVERGIIVQLGCADSERCLDLHADGQHVVQALDRDRERVAAARKRIQSQGCCGPVSVRLLRGEKLPYVDNLVNLLVVDDPLEVPEQEMIRVVRPLGIAMIRQGGTWRKVVKPWPDDVDEWTHFLHDATGNAVSQDAKVGPPRRLQWSAGPMWGRSHEVNNSFPALVTARGRMFYVFDRGLTGMEDPRLPDRWTLIARDAFNGTLLWERPLATWGSHAWQNRALRFFGGTMARRLVADQDKLYFTLEYGGAATILDAATGKTLGEIPGTEGAEEMLVAGDQVVVGSRPQRERKKLAAKITCYDLPNEKILWQAEDKALLPQLLSVGPDEVVYHNRESVVCLNRSDGSVRWRFADKPSGKRGGGKMLLVADGKVVVSSRQRIVALSVADGETVWTAPGVQGNSMREFDLFHARGTLWCSGPEGTVVGYDVRDGRQTRQLDVSSVQSQGHHLRCYRAKATEDHLITQFRGVEFLSLNEQAHTNQDWLRGTCTYGVMPANGFLYVPPHSCLCYSAAIFKGLNAFTGESRQDREKRSWRYAVGPLEKGPAYGLIPPKPGPSDESWLSYRHDARRTGASANPLPGSLKRTWKVALDAELTPPVAADGRVFVAAKNQHGIYALDAASGRQLWTFAADARVDSPPSIHRGMLVFGGADGVLYCLRADDGQLAWRRRLAPQERWMAVDGQLESVWRLHGSVLIEGDLAYCSAGRSSYLDGGLFLYAVDVETGEVKHRALLNTVADTRVDAVDDEFVPSYHIEGAHSDILVAQGGFVYLNQMKFSPDLKLQPAKYLTKEEITKRPSMNLDNKEYVNEDIFNVRWQGEQMSTYDKLAGILVDENQNVGERDLGLHLYTTSGFLDITFFNRTYWMYSKTWTGFNHANLAPKSGQLLVVGSKNTYALKAYTSRYPLSPKLDPQTKGYLLIADDNGNEPTLDPRAWGKDKGMGFSRGAPPVWHQWLPVRVQAMVLAGQTLVVCGPPDVVQEGDAMAAFEGRLGSELWTISAPDGKTIAKQQLEESP
ncbi:MAG: outer membrane protein assembly factor BamB family protein, partial [Planctomycetota bacterium]